MNINYEQVKRMALENAVQKKNRKAVYDFQCRHAGNIATENGKENKRE